MMEGAVMPKNDGKASTPLRLRGTNGLRKKHTIILDGETFSYWNQQETRLYLLSGDLKFNKTSQNKESNGV